MSRKNKHASPRVELSSDNRAQRLRPQTKSEYRRAAAACAQTAADTVRRFPGARLVRPMYCGKVAYPAQASAQYALTHIVLIGEQRDKTPVRTYHCPTCGFWHLTSRAAPSNN